jgi:hypothetical protein
MVTGTKYKMKPPMGVRPVAGHPLARGLVGCWLANEGAGSRVFDVSGYGNDATFQGSAGWRLSPLGLAMDSQGSNNNSSTPFDGTQYDELSISAWVVPDLTASTRYIVDNSPGSTGFGLRLAGTDLEFFCFSGGAAGLVEKADFFSVGQLHHIVAVHNSKNIIYGNGVYLDETNSVVGIDSSVERMQIGGDYIGAFGWDGAIVVVQIWNRSLSAGEVAWLYREPFAMFGRGGRVDLLCGSIPGTVSLAGSSSGESSASVSMKLTRKPAGSASAKSAATGILSIGDELPAILSGKSWLKDALFGGMTSNGFKLGNALSLGWFWMRVGGCSALYRGGRIDCVDFENVLVAGGPDAGFVSPPDYVGHSCDSTYVYVVRRFNRCGDRECTLGAAARVSFDASGDLVEPRPNDVFNSKADVIQGDKVLLRWFYSPLEEKSRPAIFNIYHDSGSGQVDYVNPAATIRYEGRRFYSCTVCPLGSGLHLFAIRAEDANGVENHSSAILRIQIQGANPAAIEILSVEAV